MANRFYSNTAIATTLSSNITNIATSATFAAVTGYPSSFPYTIVIDEGTALEELCSVTAAAGATLTITRGVDGTTGVAHTAGATMRHVTSARDFTEPQDHMAATAAHGATGVVVGSTNVVTMTNKTFTTPAMTAPTASGDMSGFGPAWTSWTMAWTAATTNPTIGNGTITGRYIQLGKLVVATARISQGTTTSFGSGAYSFSLPVASQSTNSFLRGQPVGGYNDLGAGNYALTPLFVEAQLTASSFRVKAAGTISVFGASDMVATATNEFVFTITYEAA